MCWLNTDSRGRAFARATQELGCSVVEEIESVDNRAYTTKNRLFLALPSEGNVLTVMMTSEQALSFGRHLSLPCSTVSDSKYSSLHPPLSQNNGVTHCAPLQISDSSSKNNNSLSASGAPNADSSSMQIDASAHPTTVPEIRTNLEARECRVGTE